MFDELISTTSYQFILGNKYLLMHTFSSIQPCGLLHGMNPFICKWFAFYKVLNETSLLQMWVSWDECIFCGYIKSCYWFINPKYANLAILLHIFPSMNSRVQYWWKCKFSSLFWYHWFVILVAFLKAFQLSLFPLVIFVMSLMCLWLKCINIQ